MNVLAILAAALPLAVSSPSADEVREYFEIVYNPEVVYLEDGSVKAVASPFTAGRITPDWSGMTAVELGRGKHRKVEYHIPVAVERETWAYKYSESDGIDRWEAKRRTSTRAPEELVITKDDKSGFQSFLLYRVFDDLEVEVDPNTFDLRTVRTMHNGHVQAEDTYLMTGRNIHKVRFASGKNFYFNTFVFPSDPAARPRVSASTPLHSSLRFSPEIQEALKKYKYFGV